MSNAKHKITFDANKKHSVIIEDYKRVVKPPHGAPHDVIEAFNREQEKANGEIFFAEEYEKAYGLVIDILDAWRHERLEECLRDKKPCYGEPDSRCSRKNEYADCNGSKSENPQNNIILFSGARGTGKTSAMRSFGKFLDKEGLKNETGEEYKNRNFKLLQMIDPSYFRKNENIVVNVITVMFKMAKCIHDKRSKSAEDYNRNSFHDLLRKYETVFNALKNMDEVKSDEQSLEYLSELAETTDLRCKIHSLIEGMLDFISQGDSRCREDHKKDIMVLMIDDLDMNLSLAPLMLEQIRKFLMVKDLIILIASNIDQLQIEMQEFYGRKFKQQVKNSDDRNIVQHHIEDISHKYLLKLFPPSRRILVGSMAKKLLETTIEIKLEENNPNKTFASQYEKQKLQNALLHLIWSRTRLIFVPEENELHPIIPINLRELQQFVFMLLEDMVEVESKNENKKKHIFKDETAHGACKSNFEKFKNHIVNTWIKSNVSAEEWKVFENMPLDVTRINKHLIQSINVIGNQRKKRLLARDVELTQIEKNNSAIKIESDIYTMVSPNDPKFNMANRISDIYNEPSNNSMGDVLLLIHKYQTYFESIEESRFINAIKIYYSMLLFETMFFRSEITLSKPNDNTPAIEAIEIQKLIGGTVYFQHYFDIITSDKYKVELTDDYDKGKGNHVFYHQYTENEFKSISSPFFVSYYGKQRPERYSHTHTYDTTKSSNNARFDILSPLSNILNPYQTLQRARITTINENFEKSLKQYYNIEESNIFQTYPYSILPIYSIDLMLKYLNEQCDFEKILIDANFKALNEIKNDINKNIETKIDVQNITKTTAINTFKAVFKDYHELYQKMLSNFIIIQKANNAHGSFYNATSETGLKKLKTILQNEDNSWVIGTNELLAAEQFESITEKFNEMTNGVSVVSLNQARNVINLTRYKYQIIDLLKNYYVCDSHERSQKLQKMVKEVQEKKSKADIMSYLVSELWVHDFQITIIHKYIQEQVRKSEFIANYYDILWKITTEAFERMKLTKEIPQNAGKSNEKDNSCNDNEICRIYDHIYTKGKKVFITPQTK